MNTPRDYSLSYFFEVGTSVKGLCKGSLFGEWFHGSRIMERRSKKGKERKISKYELLSWPTAQVTGPQIHITGNREGFIKYIPELLAQASSHTHQGGSKCVNISLFGAAQVWWWEASPSESPMFLWQIHPRKGSTMWFKEKARHFQDAPEWSYSCSICKTVNGNMTRTEIRCESWED